MNQGCYIHEKNATLDGCFSSHSLFWPNLNLLTSRTFTKFLERCIEVVAHVIHADEEDNTRG